MNIHHRHRLGAIAVAATLSSLHVDSHALDLGYLGQQILANTTVYQGTTVGGLSGLDYSAATGKYVAISDDRSALAPARFYDLTLDYSKFTRSNTPGSAGVTLTGVTTLLTPAGTPYALNTVDAESIRLRQTAAGTTVLWTSEGQRSGAASTYQAPALRESTTGGAYIRDFAVPSYYVPTGSAAGTAAGDRGVRNNLAFEGLTVSLDGSRAYVATESALVQDGPIATLAGGSPTRVAEFDMATGARTAEFVYRTDAIPVAPVPATGSADNGVSDMLAVGDRQFIMMERSFAAGVGNSIRLYLADATNATDVSGIVSLADTSFVAMTKTLLLDLATLRNDDGSVLKLDNIEGIGWGADVDGHRTLVLVSDNNFSGTQFTQFVVLSVNGDFAVAVPEPQTYALMLAGLVGIGAVVRRRRTPAATTV